MVLSSERQPQRAISAVIRANWAASGPDRRASWAADATLPETLTDLPWQELPGVHQSALIAVWLRDADHFRTEPPNKVPVEPAVFVAGPPIIRDSPEREAAAMFNRPARGQAYDDLDGVIGRARQLSPDLSPSAADRLSTRVGDVLAKVRATLRAGTHSVESLQPPDHPRPERGSQRDSDRGIERG